EAPASAWWPNIESITVMRRVTRSSRPLGNGPFPLEHEGRRASHPHRLADARPGDPQRTPWHAHFHLGIDFAALAQGYHGRARAAATGLGPAGTALVLVHAHVAAVELLHD